MVENAYAARMEATSAITIAPTVTIALLRMIRGIEIREFVIRSNASG